MGIAVGLGLANYPFAETDAFWDWVRLCEEGGVDSIWQTDRLVSGEPILECITAMAALAGATKRIKFGMNVVSVGMRDPLLLAKQLATVDVLSKGRVLPAFGIGSIRAPEWKVTGIGTEARGARTDEGLEIIARLWQGEKLNYDGRFYQYDGVRIAPIPVQKRIPMWIGGSTRHAIRRTAKYGTGWQAALETPAQAGETVRAIMAMTGEFGRSIDDDHFGAAFTFRYGRPEDEIVEKAKKRLRFVAGEKPIDHALVVGDSAAIAAQVQAFVDHGLSKFILRPLGTDDADMLAQTRRMIDEVLPEVAAMNARQKAAQASAA